MKKETKWFIIEAEAREWRKANPEIARIINPNNIYKFNKQ